MAEVTPECASDFQDFDTTRDAAAAGHGKMLRTARTAESVRLALTLLALLAGMAILGTSADTLSVYNQTHLGAEYFLALWPSDFDITPTIALIACSGAILVASAVSLVAMKVPAVCYACSLPAALLVLFVIRL